MCQPRFFLGPWNLEAGRYMQVSWTWGLLSFLCPVLLLSLHCASVQGLQGCLHCSSSSSLHPRGLCWPLLALKAPILLIPTPSPVLALANGLARWGCLLSVLGEATTVFSSSYFIYCPDGECGCERWIVSWLDSAAVNLVWDRWLWVLSTHCPDKHVACTSQSPVAFSLSWWILAIQASRGTLD